MITKPIVFVLGAGTSMPYNFPSGKQLVQTIVEIIQRLSIVDPIFKIVLERHYSRESIDSFAEAFFLSNQPSIDAFLEHRPEFADIGKLLIALVILKTELDTDLFGFNNRERGCYQYLFSKLNTNWDEFPKNKVGFVTFNYDRSLEHFLFTSLKNTYGKEDNNCARQLDHIPIIHVHGSLGKLPWQSEDGVSYGANLRDGLSVDNTTVERIRFASKQIKIVAENQSSQEFQKAFELICQAEKIYFLGFSYHQANMTRLNLLSHPKIIDIRTKTARITEIEPIQMSNFMGSGLGMEKAEIDHVERTWLVKIPDNTSDSLAFLRKYVSFE